MGYVYLLKHRGIENIKIGHTNQSSINKRIRQYNTASPTGIELIGYVKTNNASELEKEIHNELKSFRANGEWFEICVSYAKILIDKYSWKPNKKKRIALDIPYQFDYEKYSINELKAFRCFFNKLYLSPEYNAEVITKILNNEGLSNLDPLEIFNKYKSLCA